ncbi:LytR C-terminal domain-containing protein [Corynebacterium sp. 153RC1]|uniref:LytR C-terminal domain-containing protein n=1 Tax=Corynebacterium TaxID=1716 RepID=UPI00211C97E2|nr:LytR C-terminal domain-containing protein [Corynebacterium sp. 76QC2CO]MCQ9352513.1 LytR C-terminal domain-containing protein [Corynebacterium sp. 209RC1]MCQ9354697.1 LytR C-terminal domain-containing protein [Corynebacterium sp. 1222RC1]MCQ9356808.1 LytR C-terminal domain-containing protein [Corynebacterium sp. 122RC1]MCQ9358988.1 LytR C-terminal domain-containing protein [Corynebacterium sp. 142RC1]MCQ9361276.1 LytR C-terminal domain-containing protein [Corynebacterium sp. 153RC1]MCQ9363
MTEKTLPLRGMAMILIAVAVLLALWGLFQMRTPQEEVVAQETTTTTTTTAVAPPAETPPPPPGVKVLNNSTIQGLAASAGERVSGMGWEVTETGNYSDEILAQNTVFFAPGNEEAAQRLAEQTGSVTVPREGDPLVLVLVQDLP